MASPEGIPLRKKLEAFLLAEAFDMAPGYARVQEKTLEKAGLYDEDPNTLLQMKIKFMSHQNALKGRSK